MSCQIDQETSEDQTDASASSMIEQLTLRSRRSAEGGRADVEDDINYALALKSLQEARRIMYVDPRGNQVWSPERILLEILDLTKEATMEERRSRYRSLCLA